MKKYLSFIAIVLAIGFSAFTPSSKEKGLTPMYWYDLVGNSLGFGSEPNNECTTSGIGCAKGFVVEPADPEFDTPDATRKLN